MRCRKSRPQRPWPGCGASRASGALIPRILELPATTQAGAPVKAQVVLGLFGNSSGRRSAAVRSLVADLAVVLDIGAGRVKAGER